MSKLRSIHVVLSVFLLSVLLVGCSNPLDRIQNRLEWEQEAEKEEKSLSSVTETVAVPEEDKEPVQRTMTATLAAVGDILIHRPVYRDAETGTDTYDFIPMFAQVQPYMQDADLTFANSESIIGGQAIGVSTYPSFNSPHEVGDALKQSGVDIVSMANNHTLDRGEKAVLSAIDYWDQIGVAHTGSYKSAEDREKITILERNGISFSFLAYTYGTNGIKVPDGKEYLVNYIDKDKMKSDLERARETSDVVVTSLHFGNEYERMPNASQKDLAQFAVDNGADIVIGHHPHVLQPVEWLTANDGRKAFVVYSLGNFISSQDKLYRRIGGIVKIQIDKVVRGDETLSVRLTEPAFTPTFVKFKNWSGFEVIPMKDMTDGDLNNSKQHYDEIKRHMSQWMPELRID